MTDNPESLRDLTTELKQLGVAFLAPLEQIVNLDGVDCRVWIGKTIEGPEIVAFVHRIMMDKNDFATSEIGKILRPTEAPDSLSGILVNQAGVMQ